MEWILIAGALCLSNHQDICIHRNMDAISKPYTLMTPLDANKGFEYLGDAKIAGEGRARELDEFEK